MSRVLVLALMVAAAPLSAQTISRTPATQPRPVAIHRDPAPAAAPARPAPPTVIVDNGYYYYGAYAPVAYVYPTYVQFAPPPPVGDVAGPPPGPAMAFIPGSYQWNGAQYFWMAGRWVDIPAGYTRWIAGKWQRNHLGWYWSNGYWVI